MKDVNRLAVILARVARLALLAACVATAPCLVAGPTQAAATKPVAQDTRDDDMPTVFISATSSGHTRAPPPTRHTRKKPDTTRVAPRPAVPVAPQAVSQVLPRALPKHDFTGALNIPSPAPRASSTHYTLLSTEEPPPAAVHLSVRPRLLFDARRSALPANWLQVDPANQVPLMRQAVGVDSEYVRRLVGVEVGYSASGAAEKSRFLLDVRTNSLDQDTVRAAVGIPLN